MDTPTLKHLMGAYFHQDFEEVDGGAQQALSAFLADGPDKAAALLREIADVLHRFPAEADVDTFLTGLGCAYWAPPEEGGYRGWLTDIAAYVAAQSHGPAVTYEGPDSDGKTHMDHDTAMWRLAGIYLNEDWPFDYDNWEEAVDAFIGEFPQLADRLPAELDEALATHRTDAELEAFMEAQGSAYLPRPADGDYRTWLTGMAAYVAAKTADRH